MPFFKDNFKDLNICDIYETLISFPVYVLFRIVKFMLYVFSLLLHAFLLYLSLFIKNNMIKKKYIVNIITVGKVEEWLTIFITSVKSLFVPPKEARNDDEDS